MKKRKRPKGAEVTVVVYPQKKTKINSNVLSFSKFLPF